MEKIMFSSFVLKQILYIEVISDISNNYLWLEADI